MRNFYKEISRAEKVLVWKLMWAIYNFARKGYPPAKYQQFMATMIDLGYDVYIYCARSTKSKYVYVVNRSTKSYLKVRFSDHKANKWTEDRADSDVYVGHSHGGVLTTEALIDEIKAGKYSEFI